MPAGANAKEQKFKTQAEVRTYVVEKAKEAGVPTFRALYVLDHESQDCFRHGYFEPDMQGDEGASIGCWQIHLKSHKDVTYRCAADLICATAWSMPHLLKEPKIWSAWRFRRVWYLDIAQDTSLP